MVKDTIIGVGLNVNQTEFKSDAPNPVSMKQLTGKDTDREEVLKAFIDEMNECCRTRKCIAEYKARLYRREGKHKFMKQNTVFEASIVDVKDDGRLMLEDEKGIAHLFRFKEVTFII
jgi:BirA family biotin operon repressor/biotin-[acetyl-CoA-carboxylase] ligase